MKPFQEMGEAIARRWRATNYVETTFPGIATEALREFSLAERLHGTDVVKWLFESPTVPRQPDPDSKFGQPPLTVFRDQGFQVDVLFWLTGSTSIHQHSFSGAFAMLEGESVHCEYDFSPSHEVNAGLTGGALTLRHSELLKRGDIRSIIAGMPFIHSTYHVGRPTITIVVRTGYEPIHAPQYDYVWPTVRKVVDRWNECLARQVEMLRFLALSKSPEGIPLALRLIANADAYSCFAMLEQCLAAFKKQEDRELLVAAVRQKHGELIDKILFPALNEFNRQLEFYSLLKKSDVDGERLVLAALLTVPSRSHFARLMAARFGGDAMSQVASVLRSVLETTCPDEAKRPHVADAAARWILGAHPSEGDAEHLVHVKSLRTFAPFVREE